MKPFRLLSFTLLLVSPLLALGEPLPSATSIECTLPDGRVVEVSDSSAAPSGAPALRVGEDMLTCPLQEGETTFVIKLSQAAFLDRFTFVNENATAAGRLKISVANDRLPVKSAQWVEVDGNIAFSRKRLFNVSTVGVEARYVKLSFHVEKTERVASLGR